MSEKEPSVVMDACGNCGDEFPASELFTKAIIRPDKSVVSIESICEMCIRDAYTEDIANSIINTS